MSLYKGSLKVVIVKARAPLKISSEEKILAFELKAFADDKLHVSQNNKYLFNRIENIVGKGQTKTFLPDHG